MSEKSVEAVLGRIREVLGVVSDSELSRVTGVNRQTLSNWKSRESIPYTLCVNVSEEHDVSLDWLVAGRGEKAIKPASSVGEEIPSYKSDLSPREKIALDLFNKLTVDQQQEVLQDAKEKQRIADMETQLERLQAEMNEFKKSG